MLRERGPLLIAANHPNSFLDAIIVSSLFKKPVYSLARGDAFAGKFYTKILKSCNMLPVYRLSEGHENLENNYTTFDACQKLFEENKIVLIFTEGGCKNEWKLRPLKKGTARLAMNAWQNDIQLKVLPLGINYSSFRFYGKNVHLNFGSFISKEDVDEINSDGKSMNEFNKKLKAELKQLVYEINEADTEKLSSLFFKRQSLVKKILLFIPAVIGFILNAPLYLTIHLVIKKRASDHYDSIMTAALFLFFPLYVLTITLIVFFTSGKCLVIAVVAFDTFHSVELFTIEEAI